RNCPYRIGIVSTGLVVQGAPEANFLLQRRFGTVILDEAHKARVSRTLGGDPQPNKLLQFMRSMGFRARDIVLGTATPIQTDTRELWDLLEILNQGGDFVLGRATSWWRRAEEARRVLTGEREIQDQAEAWQWLRNPLPSKYEHTIFDHIRSELRVRDD